MKRTNKTMDVTMIQPLSEKRTDEKNVPTVEYAVMLVLVAVAAAAFGGDVSTALTARSS